MVDDLNKGEAHPSWSNLAAFLQNLGLDGIVEWLLDAFGPLTVLATQALNFGEPFLRSNRSQVDLKELTNLLGDQEKSRDFAAFLREKRQS